MQWSFSFGVSKWKKILVTNKNYKDAPFSFILLFDYWPFMPNSGITTTIFYGIQQIATIQKMQTSDFKGN